MLNELYSPIAGILGDALGLGDVSLDLRGVDVVCDLFPVFYERMQGLHFMKIQFNDEMKKGCIGCLRMQRILKFNLLKKVFLFTPVSNQYMSLMNTTSNQQMARHKYRDTMFRQDR